MNKLTKMKRAGTTIFAEPNEISRYKRSGFVEVEETEEVITPDDENAGKDEKKTLSRLKADELKQLAAMLDVDVKDMKAADIKEAIKALDLDAEVLQGMIDTLEAE